MRHYSISWSYWKDIVQEFYNLLRGVIVELSSNPTLDLLSNVCRIRHIKKEEVSAMLDMCRNIQSKTNLDARPQTVAAIVFWKICQFSSRYYKRIVLEKICRNHEKLILKGHEDLTFKFFDVTSDNVKKVYKQHLKSELFTKLLVCDLDVQAFLVMIILLE